MIHPVITYVLLALGLIGCIALFLTLKIEVQQNAKKHRRRMQEIAAEMAAEMAAQIKQASEHPPVGSQAVYVASTVRPGFNLSKRFQTMRMLRRGEDVAHIAAALGVSQREVELLIRVQGIGAAAISKAAGSR